MAQDLDQGGVQRQWMKTYFGPSLGWDWTFFASVQPVTTATALIERGTTVVLVNFNGAVSVQLQSTIPRNVVPRSYFKTPLYIIDLGGFAGTPGKEITITPAGGENIMGLANIQIASSHGSFALLPKDTGGWEQV